jgi:peptidyl-lysine (3S)-dioxygenase / protease
MDPAPHGLRGPGRDEPPPGATLENKVYNGLDDVTQCRPEAMVVAFRASDADGRRGRAPHDPPAAAMAPGRHTLGQAHVQGALQRLRDEARELWVAGQVPRTSWHPTALSFLRDYVSVNQPVILTGVPVPAWATGEDAILRAAGGEEIDVNWTADGSGDAVHGSMFVKPHRRRQTMASFLAALRGGRGDVCGVPYYSAQDDCLRRQLPGLAARDLPDLSFASDAFGVPAEAVNLWIGDARSTTSLHKDHYENCFLVACGEKQFTLRPPVDVPLLCEGVYRAATYAPSGPGGALVAVPDEPAASVPWVTAPDDPRGEIVATLRPGEMLYLPSLWYHSVQQRGFTVGLKYVLSPPLPAARRSCALRRRRCGR